jgi:hypothetical protein
MATTLVRMPLLVIVCALALLVLAALGFWPPYLSRLPGNFDGYTHLHAVLGTAWLLLVAAQALLVHRRRLATHRLLGKASFLLAPAFVISGILLAHHRLSSMSEVRFSQEGFTLYLPAVMVVLFSASFALGMIHRRNYQLHWRFMTATLLTLVDPVLARLLFFYLPPLPELWLYQAITFSLIVAIAWLLFRSLPPATPHRKTLRAYFVGSTAALILWFFMPFSAHWLAVASWFRSLPIT